MSIEDHPLYDHVVERLLDDATLDTSTVNFVEAALRGESALSQALAADELPRVQRASAREGQQKNRPRLFLEEINVQGFRGAGTRATLTLPPGPGLTLVVGRNGAGKSTFAEGLETLLAKTSLRWSDRPADWKKGWRNLGHTGPTEVSCSVFAESLGSLRARRIWAEGVEDVMASTFAVEGVADEGFEALGWDAACRENNPFLGYRELAKMVDTPSAAFDALHQVLGMEIVSAAQALLDSAFKGLKDDEQQLKRATVACRSAVSDSGQARAARLAELMQAKSPDVAAVRAELALASSPTGKNAEHWQRLATARVPEKADWDAHLEAVSAAFTRCQSASSAAAESSDGLVSLLESALLTLEKASGACPVCGQSLAEGAPETIRRRMAEARANAGEYREARAAARTVLAKARDFVLGITRAAAADARHLGLSEALETWIAGYPEAAGAGADEVLRWFREHGEPVRGELGRVRELAQAELQQRDTEFQDVAAQVAAWATLADRVERQKPTVRGLKEAKDWLKQHAEELREARFAPLKAAALQNWELLGADSDIVLKGVELKGTKTTRRVDLSVELDGRTTPAVSVLSQGEINCMALSLFLPRALLSESPFGFVVIDDPVQSMDQARVGGLARVLQNAAEKLQVVVFTHDHRLVEAVRRLQLPATILEVHRQKDSMLEVRTSSTPVKRYIDDAKAVLWARGVGDELPKRVVPGFCRLAIEAACLERIHRARLRAGESIESIADEVRGAGLLPLVAMALFGDRERAEHVYEHLNRSGRKKEASAIWSCKQGAHGKPVGDLTDLVHWSERFSNSLIEGQ